jgi:hypothetical protein
MEGFGVKVSNEKYSNYRQSLLNWHTHHLKSEKQDKKNSASSVIFLNSCDFKELKTSQTYKTYLSLAGH